MITKETGLGYFVRDGLKICNFIDYDEYSDGKHLYVLDGVYGDSFDFLRILFLSLFSEGLLSHKELQEYVYKWSGHWYADEGYIRDECINDILGLNVFKTRGIKDIDEAILYLNQFRVNPLIITHPELIYGNCFFTEHGFMFYDSDVSGKMYIAKYIVEGDECKRKNRDYIDQTSKSFLPYDFSNVIDPGKNYIHMIDMTKEYDSADYWKYSVKIGGEGSKIIPIYSPGGVYVYISDRYNHLLIYSLMKKKVTVIFDGEIVAFSDKRIILKNDNRLYAVYENSVKEIFEIPKFMMVASDSFYTKFEDEEIDIKPVIRGFMMGCKIDYNGNYIGDTFELRRYVWNTFIELETIANKLSFNNIFVGEDSDGNIIPTNPVSWCSVNNILLFFESIKESNREYYVKTNTLRTLIRLLGEYFDKDSEIANVLLWMRHMSILDEEDYWDDMISKVNEHYSDDISRIQRYDDDIISKDNSAIIDYNHLKFLTTQYMEKIFKMHQEGRLQKYLENIKKVYLSNLYDTNSIDHVEKESEYD